ncbi:MAG: hypothetical protein JWO93_1649, partial [Micrococcaceae bacterium]|nr:hypothetical protein [Micrococcaceae bacterium]
DSESTIPIDPFEEISDRDVVELNRAALRGRRSSKYVYDFFGPSIDTGFRILNSCSDRYFTMTVEVAWAMSRCAAETGVDNSDHHLEDIVLMDTKMLKGVWKGRDYPIFAVDRKHGDLVNRALRKFRGSGVTASAVSDLCLECSKSPGWPSRLYLPRSGVEAFKIVPTDSLDRLRDNSMEGAESLPPVNGGRQELETAPPLG